MSTLNVDKVDPSRGTALELGTSGDTINVPSGVTLDINSGATLDATGATITGALANTPSFSAYMSADQTGIADATYTKLSMNAEVYDTDSAYDTSLYRFTVPAGKGGKYQFGISLYIESAVTVTYSGIGLYKNGTRIFQNQEGVDNIIYKNLFATLPLVATDYIEAYVLGGVSGGTLTINQDVTDLPGQNNRAYWYGYKLIG